MNGKQIHMSCDFFIFLIIILILILFYFLSVNLQDHLFIIHRLNESWNQKPFQYMQSTLNKPCKDLGMIDLYRNVWPGTHLGCKCRLDSGESIITKGYCPKDISNNCKTVNPEPSLAMTKWKQSFVCGSTIHSQSYFQLNKISPDKECPENYKKCGVLDTIGNILCINKNERCPINEFEIISDENSMNIKADNSKTQGIIYSNFKVEEFKPCINPFESSLDEKNNPLLDINSNTNINYTCTSYIKDEKDIHYHDNHFKLFDEYSMRDYYNDNGLNSTELINSNILSNLGSRKIKFYAGAYIGWRRECQKKEIFSFLNKGNGKEEISRSLEQANRYNLYIDILLFSIVVNFFFGIVLFKYYKMNTNSNKLEFSGSSVAYLFLMYFILLLLFGLTIYISDISLEILKTSKMANNFFETISNVDCSDEFTNSSLRYYKKIFYANAGRYFNVKVFSFFGFVFCLFFLIYIYFTKFSSIESTRKTKSKHVFNKIY